VKKRAELEDEARRWLEGERTLWYYFQSAAELAALWDEHGADIVADHVAEYPGTRPARWWTYSAPRSPIGTYPGCNFDGELPEPRLRLGGIGTPLSECSAHVPAFEFGLPIYWPGPSDVAGEFRLPRAVAIGPGDPPRFESQAAYLRRHRLFLTGEARRLTAEDYQPETLPWLGGGGDDDAED
jgi:hypothetical protein